jgi:hypothetical protein
MGVIGSGAFTFQRGRWFALLVLPRQPCLPAFPISRKAAQMTDILINFCSNIQCFRPSDTGFLGLHHFQHRIPDMVLESATSLADATISSKSGNSALAAATFVRPGIKYLLALLWLAVLRFSACQFVRILPLTR